MQVDDMREKIASVYPGAGWKWKVRHMPEKQVMAVYFDFLKRGRFDKPKKAKAKEPEYVQLTIWDII